MAKAGRPSKLTPDVQEGICNAIRDGLTYEQAAIFNGIGESTFYAWKAKGDKQKSGVYSDFVEAIKKANIVARAIHLQRIHKASQGGEQFEETSVTEKTERDPATGQEVVVARETRTTKKRTLPQWQASAWILERRFPSEFGKHVLPELPDEKDPLQEWLDGLEEAQSQYEPQKLEATCSRGSITCFYQSGESDIRG